MRVTGSAQSILLDLITLISGKEYIKFRCVYTRNIAGTGECNTDHGQGTHDK